MDSDPRTVKKWQREDHRYRLVYTGLRYELHRCQATSSTTWSPWEDARSTFDLGEQLAQLIDYGSEIA